MKGMVAEKPPGVKLRWPTGPVYDVRIASRAACTDQTQVKVRKVYNHRIRRFVI